MERLRSVAGTRPTVTIAGGGVAALEALLALRAYAEDRVGIHLVAPSHTFSYKPLAVTEAFGGGPTPTFDLRPICRRFDAQLTIGSVEAVEPLSYRVRLDEGPPVAYDALVVAVGARPRPWLDDAITIYGPGFTARLAGMLFALESGDVGTVTFVVPPTASWTLPVYELALQTALRAREAGRAPTIRIVTPEPQAIALFGGEASAKVDELLADRGIELITARSVVASAHGELTLAPHAGGPLATDRTVTLPQLEGPALPGLISDGAGFLPVDPFGRVHGEADVYAAGDVTSGAIRQGGIATQQADAVAETLAARAGAPVTPSPFRPVVRAILLTGGEPQHLRASVTGGHGEDAVASSEALWWPAGKIAGRHLSPYLASLAHAAPTGAP